MDLRRDIDDVPFEEPLNMKCAPFVVRTTPKQSIGERLALGTEL